MAFAFSAPLACVVVLGAETATVACVEDGLEHPGSRVTVPLGGDDCARALRWAVGRRGGEWMMEDVPGGSGGGDAEAARATEELRRLSWNAAAPQPGAAASPREGILRRRRPGAPTAAFRVPLTKSGALAWAGLFLPPILGERGASPGPAPDQTPHCSRTLRSSVDDLVRHAPCPQLRFERGRRGSSCLSSKGSQGRLVTGRRARLRSRSPSRRAGGGSPRTRTESRRRSSQASAQARLGAPRVSSAAAARGA